MDKPRWFTVLNAQTPEPEIYIYGDIGGVYGLEAVTSKSFIEEWNAIVARKPKAIHLHINSGGGDVWEGFAIYTAIKHQQSKVIAHIDGIAASMASIIAMAAGRVLISEAGSMMIHDVWSMVAGTSDDMRKEADVLDMYNEIAVGAYVDKTGQDRETIRAAMKETSWFNAAQAVEFGLADEIEEAVAMAAHCDPIAMLERWGKVPDHIRESLQRLAIARDAPELESESTDQSAPGIAGVDDPYQVRAWVDKLNHENHERRRATRAALDRKQRAREALDTA